jgi:CHAT domain-containing protein
LFLTYYVTLIFCLNNIGREGIDKKIIRYLTSYDALRNIKHPNVEKRAVLFADPDYSCSIENPHNYSTQIQQMLPQLPHTEEEIVSIKKILEEKEWEVDTFTKEKASVENLQKQKSPKILHIATHGFFRNIDIDKMELEESLLYTGIFLSASLILSENNQTVLYDGNAVLRAYEIQNLNLTSNDLVVLSACDTGQGYDLAAGAAYGIQRSFLIAGAKQVISTLWKVPDEQTKELIILFYQNVADGEDYETALRKAQLQIKAKYKHPFFWGAFILLKNS